SPAARRLAARRSGLDRGHQLGETGLAVRGLVLVDDALGGGLVELAGGDLQGFAGGIGVPGGDGRADLADVGLELRLHRAVAQSCLLVRLVSLDLGLDVCHEDSSLVLCRWIIRGGRGSAPTGTGGGDSPGDVGTGSLPRVLTRVARTAAPGHGGLSGVRTPRGMSHIRRERLPARPVRATIGEACHRSHPWTVRTTSATRSNRAGESRAPSRRTAVGGRRSSRSTRTSESRLCRSQAPVPMSTQVEPCWSVWTSPFSARSRVVISRATSTRPAPSGPPREAASSASTSTGRSFPRPRCSSYGTQAQTTSPGSGASSRRGA